MCSVGALRMVDRFVLCPLRSTDPLTCIFVVPIGTVREPDRERGPMFSGCHNRQIPFLIMKPSRLLVRLASGAVTNVEFSDALRLVEALGFEELRIAGSHHVFARPGIAEQLNLQDRRGQAKPYQLRQLMTLVQRYDLRVEEGK